MPKIDTYHEAYTRAGDVAVLCEGDIIGYEAAILRRWADSELKTDPLVDIWPCGTARAIFGLSDAIGRSRPLMVIEDRDFRTQGEASEDCAESKKDRERRDVRVLGWYAWRRNEIENYLLEPDVLFPVMADVFEAGGCAIDDVRNGLSDILPALSVYQATQYALYRARQIWDRSDPSAILPSNITCRPEWDDLSHKPIAPDPNQVRHGLKGNVAKWNVHFVDNATPAVPLQGKSLLEDFEAKYAGWENVKLGDPTWRLDWSGKDVLQWLRIWLTSRYGWPNPQTGERLELKWGGLTRTKRDSQDRQIEAAIRPMLVRRFVAHIVAQKSGEIYEEFSAFKNSLRAYRA